MTHEEDQLIPKLHCYLQPWEAEFLGSAFVRVSDEEERGGPVTMVITTESHRSNT